MWSMVRVPGGLLIAAAIAVVSIGCGIEGAVDDSDLETIVIHQPAVAQVPEWASQHTDEMMIGVSPEPAPPDSVDPCSCTTEQCLDDWVDENIGCGVCIVVFCGGDPHVHHCSFCVSR